MKLLVISFHYPPDLGAGAFRTEALIRALQAKGSADIEIDVFTCMPNRYRAHTPEFKALEVHGNVRIHRFPVRLRRAGMASLLMAYLSFARYCSRAARGKQWDVVFATASRLMPAVIGALIARSRKSRLYVDFRDLFVENLAAVKPQWYWRPVLGIVARLERWVLEKADHISVVSADFVDRLRRQVPQAKISVYPNGIDEAFVAYSKGKVESHSLDWKWPIQAVYAGNIGEGQGLAGFLPELAEQLGGRVQFMVYGDGARRMSLEQRLKDRGIENVQIFDPVPRSQLPAIYQRADLLLLHLAPLSALQYVVPSKLFEYAASGRPILAGVAGYSARLIEAEVDNAAVFPPGNVGAAVSGLERLKPKSAARQAFCERYNRARIMSAMAGEILALTGGSKGTGSCEAL